MAKVKNSKKEEIIQENILKNPQEKDSGLKGKQILDNRPVLNRQDTQKKIQRNLSIARRKMEQILKDHVNNKLTDGQITNLSNIMAEGTALNKT